MEFSPYWIVGNEEQRVEERVHGLCALSSLIEKIVEEMKCDGIMNFRLA